MLKEFAAAEVSIAEVAELLGYTVAAYLGSSRLDNECILVKKRLMDHDVSISELFKDLWNANGSVSILCMVFRYHSMMA